jgi:hypothetical protein
MLDLINGIVMSGEVALQQLSSVVSAEANRKAKERVKEASNPYYLGEWISKYLDDNGLPLSDKAKE